MHIKVLLMVTCLALSGGAYALSYGDVLGKVFLASSGSSNGVLLTSVYVKIKGRNTVSVGFANGSVVWGETNVEAISDASKPPELTEVMLHCKEKRYSAFPLFGPKNTYEIKEFNSGMMFKWGDYDSSGLMAAGMSDTQALTKYFRSVCEYTSQ